MRRDPLRDQAPARSEEALRRSEIPGDTRWFEARDPTVLPPPKQPRTAWIGAPLIGLALIGLALIPSLVPRVLILVMLVAAAVLIVLRGRRPEKQTRQGPR